MAVKTGIVTYPQKGVVKIVWTGLANGDTGDVQGLPRFGTVTVSVKGTFGAGGSVSIQGTSDGGTTFDTLNDTRGESNALTFTAQDTRMLLETPEGIRPNVTAGDGTTSLTITAIGTTTARS